MNTGRFTPSGSPMRNRKSMLIRYRDGFELPIDYLLEPEHEAQKPKIDRKRHLSVLTEVCVYGFEVLGMSMAKIGKELGYSREYIRQVINKTGYSPEELKLKRHLHSNNVK